MIYKEALFHQINKVLFMIIAWHIGRMVGYMFNQPPPFIPWHIIIIVILMLIVVAPLTRKWIPLG